MNKKLSINEKKKTTSKMDQLTFKFNATKNKYQIMLSDGYALQQDYRNVPKQIKKNFDYVSK